MKFSKGRQNRVLYWTSAAVALILAAMLTFYWQHMA